MLQTLMSMSKTCKETIADCLRIIRALHALGKIYAGFRSLYVPVLNRGNLYVHG